MKTRDGRLTVISGASRSGKTAYAVKLAGKAPRVIAYDPEMQWRTLPGWIGTDSAADFATRALAAKAQPLRLAFTPPPGADARTAFELFAKVAFHLADTYGPLTIIGEELADVSTPGKALQWWGTLIRRGLKRGASIIAISQRWAEADKTAIGNASEIVVFRASSADDVRYLAKKTRIPAAQIDALRPLEFVKFDTATQTATPGKLRF